MASGTEARKKEIARASAAMLLDIEAVHFNSDTPFKLASGRPSPVYIDCRKLIAHPRERSLIVEFLEETVLRAFGHDSFDNVAGGETAGIPFAALLADRMGMPMSYVRKKPKGYGRDARIEGRILEGDRVLLVEDLATDGLSKLGFADGIREAGGLCSQVAVIFYYGIFPDSERKLADHGLSLARLCEWRDVLEVAAETGRFGSRTLAAVKEFLDSPADWKAP